MAEGITREELEPIAAVNTFRNDDHEFRLVVRRIDDSVIVEEEARELDLPEPSEDDWWTGDASFEVPVNKLDELIAALTKAKESRRG